jgi:hypothetical protein
MPCRFYQHWLDHFNYTWRTVQFMRSPHYVAFSSLLSHPLTCSNSLITLFSDTPSIWSPIHVRSQSLKQFFFCFVHQNFCNYTFKFSVYHLSSLSQNFQELLCTRLLEISPVFKDLRAWPTIRTFLAVSDRTWLGINYNYNLVITCTFALHTDCFVNDDICFSCALHVQRAICST